MHELSMADSMINAIINVAKKNEATSITEATLEVGKLTMLNPEQLRFMIDVLREDTLLKNATININMIPIEIECGDCGFKGVSKVDESMDHLIAVAKCPKCNKTDVHVTKGQECNVKTIKIEKE